MHTKKLSRARFGVVLAVFFCSLSVGLIANFKHPGIAHAANGQNYHGVWVDTNHIRVLETGAVFVLTYASGNIVYYSDFSDPCPGGVQAATPYPQINLEDGSSADGSYPTNTQLTEEDCGYDPNSGNYGNTNTVNMNMSFKQFVTSDSSGKATWLNNDFTMLDYTLDGAGGLTYTYLSTTPTQDPTIVTRNYVVSGENVTTMNPCGPSQIKVNIYNKGPIPTQGSATLYTPQSLVPCKAMSQVIPLQPLGTTLPPPPSPPPPSPGGSPSDPCPVDSSFLLRWVTCPVLDAMDSTAMFINNIIGSLLAFPVGEIFGQSSGFQGPFNIFRNAGLALLVVAGLVMVISQALDLTILEPYTVRKALPRIAFAIVGISLAWPLLQFAIVLTNDLGYWIGSIIISIAHAQGNGGPNNLLLFTLTSSLAALIGAIYVAGSIFAIATPGGMLALLGIIILALLVGLMVLAFRQIVILICILAAPLALAASVLPSTEKLWKFWKDTFLTTLLMYPIIMAFLASGAAMGHIAASVKTGGILMNFLSIILYVTPYFLIPFSFKLAGGLMSTVFSLANDRNKGLFDRAKKYMEGEKEWAKQQRMEGRTKFGSSRLGSLYRRANTRGGLDFSKTGNARYKAYERKLLGGVAKNIVEKEDMGAAGGDDLATELASQFNMTESKFLSDYSTRKKAMGVSAADADAQALEALGAIQNSFSAPIGSRAMEVAAFKARVASTTGYGGDDAGAAEMVNDAMRMYRSGRISKTDAILTIKSNQKRADFSAMGFTELSDVLDGSPLAATGQTLAGDTLPEIVKLRESARIGMQPGQLLYGHKNAVKAMNPFISSNVKDLAAKYDSLVASGAPKVDIDNAYEDLLKNVASVAGLHDAMSQASPQNARILADGVMKQEVSVAGKKYTMHEIIEANRGEEWFQQMRREYMNAAARAGAGNVPGPGGPGAPGGGGGTP